LAAAIDMGFLETPFLVGPAFALRENRAPRQCAIARLCLVTVHQQARHHVENSLAQEMSKFD